MNCTTCKASNICDHHKYGVENCNNYIPRDVVAVIRCKECVHKHKFTLKDVVFCTYDGKLTPKKADGYCDCGKRSCEND